MTVIAVSDDTFEQEVLNSAEPVVVDFFAEWCGPCKAIAPALHEAADELAGKVKIVKVDVDKSRAATEKYGVRAMPTLLVIKDGTVVSRHMGALVQKAKLLEWIASASAASGAPPEPRAEEFKLANGLHLLVVPNPRATSCTIRTLYKVGEADDIAGANLLKALLPQVADKQQRVPAQTLLDYTLFLQSVPADELQAAMQTDAARMAQLNITDADVTEAKQKLLEALARSNSEVQLAQEMGAALYGSHPYAMQRSSAAEKVAGLSLEHLVSLHKQHCSPNNAVVIVSGPVTAEAVKQLAEATYGKVAANPDVRERARPDVAMIDAGQRFMGTEARAKKGLFSRRYVVPGYASAADGEAEALEVLAQVLNGKGRLTKPAVGDERPEVIARANYSANLGNGEILLRSMERDPETTEVEVDQVIEGILSKGVTEQEVASAKERLVADLAVANYDEKTIPARYDAVAIGVPLSRIEGRPAAIAKVTAQDVRSVAGKYLDLRRAVTGWILPEVAAVAETAELAKAV